VSSLQNAKVEQRNYFGELVDRGGSRLVVAAKREAEAGVGEKTDNRWELPYDTKE